MLTKEMQDRLDIKADAAAEKIVIAKRKEVVTDKSARRNISFPVPNIFTIHKSAEDDGEFRFVRLFKALREKNFDYAPQEMALMEKAMSTNDDSLGGYLVPPEQSAQIIDFLGANAAIRQVGAEVMPMRTGTLPITRISSGVNTFYLGENVSGTEDDVDTGQVVLNARTLTALVPVSNQLLADASPQAENSIRRTIGRSIGIKETEAFLTDTGGVAPLGLLRLPNLVTQTSINKNDLTVDDIQDLLTAVENAESFATGILMTPALYGECRKIKDQNDRPILQTTSRPNEGTLLDVPVVKTTKARIGTTHYMLAANYPDEVVIGQRMALEFAVSEHVEFKKNQTVIRAILRHDIVARHEEALVAQPVTGF